MPVSSTPSHGFTSGAHTSLTISHTSDSNPLYFFYGWYVASAGIDAADIIVSVTYNGSALTEIGRGNIRGNTMGVWRLGSPSSGAHDLIITLSSARRIAGGVLNLSGWPSAPVDHNFVAQYGGTPPALSVPSDVSGEVISWLGFNLQTNDVTEPSGSTLLWNDEGAGSGTGAFGDQLSAGAIQPGAAGSVVAQWSATQGEAMATAAISSGAIAPEVSRNNLLTGENHAVQGTDNLIAGSDGTITGDRNVLFALCEAGSPGEHEITGDETFKVCADIVDVDAETSIDLNAPTVRINGQTVTPGITQLTGDVTAGPGSGSQAATIANDAVTNAKAANMAQSTIKGRAVGAGTGDPTDLTATQATAILDTVVGDSGSGGTKGLVPAPAAGDAAAGKFLKADGTFAVPSGSGSISGPVSSTDRGLASWNGTGGNALRDTSGPTLESDGRISNITDPSTAQDAATKAYVDTASTGSPGTPARTFAAFVS